MDPDTARITPVSNGNVQPSKLPAVLASHGRLIPFSAGKLPGESHLIGDRRMIITGSDPVLSGDMG
jgi:hypothetical protein